MKIYSRNDKIIHGELDNNQIMVNMEMGKYFGLNPVAKRIWDIVDRPKRLDEIIDTLMDEYDVQRDICTTEVNSFLKKAIESGVIVEDESC